MEAPMMESTPPQGPGLGPESIPGILDEGTLAHLLDVELARARRYEHPFSLMRVTLPDGPPARLRLVAGALRLHTRWSDSVGVFETDSLMLILRDTAAPAAHAAAQKIAAATREELGPLSTALRMEIVAWRKGDDRTRMLARLRPLTEDA